MAPAGRRRPLALILLLLAALLVTVAYCQVFANQHLQDARHRALVAEQQLLSKQIATLAAQTAYGVSGSSKPLHHLTAAFERNLQQLQVDAAEGPGSEVALRLAEMQGVWRHYQDNARIVSDGGAAVIELRAIADTIKADALPLIALTDQVATLMALKGAQAEQVYISARQLLLIQRITHSLDRVLAGGEGAVIAADRFGRDAALYGRVLSGLRHGDSSLGIQRVRDVQLVEKLEELAVLFEVFAHQVGEVLERSPEAFQISEAAHNLLSQSDSLLEALSALDSAYRAAADSRRADTLFGSIFAAQAALQ